MKYGAFKYGEYLYGSAVQEKSTALFVASAESAYLPRKINGSVIGAYIVSVGGGTKLSRIGSDVGLEISIESLSRKVGALGTVTEILISQYAAGYKTLSRGVPAVVVVVPLALFSREWGELIGALHVIERGAFCTFSAAGAYINTALPGRASPTGLLSIVNTGALQSRSSVNVDVVIKIKKE